MKLPLRIGELTGEGAAVLAMSIDTPETAARLASDLGLPFPILSDPSMEMIRAFRMKGERMDMAELGYVIVDKQGRIRTRQTDHRFAENFGIIVGALRRAKNQP